MLRETTSHNPGKKAVVAASPVRVLGRGLASVTLATALMTGLVSSALADELDDRQSRAKQAVNNSRVAVSQSTDRLAVANQKLMEVAQELEAAKAELAAATTARDQAQAEDRRRDSELKVAEQELAAAKAAVAKGEADLAAQRKVVGMNVRETRQQNTTLLSIGILVSNFTTNDINNRVQWATTLYNASQAEMDRLHKIQVELEAAKTKMAKAEATARELRLQAANQLAVSRNLEARANSAAQNVETRVAQQAAVRAGAEQELAAAKRDQAQLQSDYNAITARIQERNARLEAERIARERAAAAAAARAAGRPAPAAPAPPAAAPAPANQGSLLLRPSHGPITSPFGNRFHPILGYWAFHEGVDFGDPCGAPLYASESGTVRESGWVGGYGYYIVIDHGRLGGSYISTGYGHLSRLGVVRGQHVQRGQVIGYIGTTGLSTGCHLHWNVWQNGKFVNGLNFL